MFHPHSLYASLLLALTLSLGFQLASAAVLNNRGGNKDSYGQPYCKNLNKRYEWRTLSDAQKGDYIRAVQCLQQKPAVAPALQEAKSRFDEFQAYHLVVADVIHHVGQFLPWHRYWLVLYENALRNECGYQGRTPYWDWTIDADSNSISKSPIFDPTTGFGGDGVPGTYTLPPNIPADEFVFPDEWRGCVQSGPFANYTIHIGPGKQMTEHCLVRQIDDKFSKYVNSDAVGNVSRSENFEVFRVQLDGMPLTDDHRLHDGGHLSVGGEMSNLYSSAADPVFYLHHANLDRVWWNWQQQNSSRLYEISGPTTFVGPTTVGGPPVDAPPTENVTLDFPLIMSDAIGPTIPIWQSMNIYSEFNCYEYV